MTKQLEENYQSIFDQIELLIFLKAPSFEQIFEWRNLQKKNYEKSCISKLDEQTSAG